MKPVLIRHGAKTRVVYSPGRNERIRLTALLPTLAAAERRAAQAAGTASVAHGFIGGRSPVTAAQQHARHAVTVSADLAGWFDSVRPEQIAAGLVTAGLPPEEADRLSRAVCCPGVPPSPRPDEQAPRQGLPTSPSAANLAAIELDRRILAALRELPCTWTYTRYADDLTVSLSQDRPELVEQVKVILGTAALAMGWRLATHKTRVQHAAAGRRVICGVSVADNLRAPRSMRRRLRAARHQHPEGAETHGLAEWCAMRLPRAARPERVILRPGQTAPVNGCLAEPPPARTPAQPTTTRTQAPTVAPVIPPGQERRVIRRP